LWTGEERLIYQKRQWTVRAVFGQTKRAGRKLPTYLRGTRKLRGELSLVRLMHLVHVGSLSNRFGNRTIAWQRQTDLGRGWYLRSARRSERDHWRAGKAVKQESLEPETKVTAAGRCAEKRVSKATATGRPSDTLPKSNYSSSCLARGAPLLSSLSPTGALDPRTLGSGRRMPASSPRRCS